MTGEARKGHWLIATDVMYLDFSSADSSVRSVDLNPGFGPINIATTALDVGSETSLTGWVWTLVGGYAAIDQPRASLDVIGGSHAHAGKARRASATSSNGVRRCSTTALAVLLDQAGGLALRRRGPGRSDLMAKLIKDTGGIGNQFHHVIDIVPTILDAAGMHEPKVVDGIEQSPIEGVNMAYSFASANAQAPSTHHTRCLEMMGDRAVYHDGWIASTEVVGPPWVTFGPANQDPTGTPWELYHLTKAWTQSENMVDQYPEKLDELQDPLWVEAEKY